MMVTGGFTGYENTKSTEIFTAGATAWTQCGELPHPGCEFCATNLNNVIYLLGKYQVKSAISSQCCVQVEILRY